MCISDSSLIDGLYYRWFDYSAYGTPIDGTRIIPIKTPLKQVGVLCHCSTTKQEGKLPDYCIPSYKTLGVYFFSFVSLLTQC